MNISISMSKTNIMGKKIILPILPGVIERFYLKKMDSSTLTYPFLLFIFLNSYKIGQVGNWMHFKQEISEGIKPNGPPAPIKKASRHIKE